MGFRPIIAIDSAHMSGSYGGALFSATAYDVNDSMFPLAFGVMSSENYEDWLWFLEKLKIVVGNKEVIIISDRYPALLCSVTEVFGLENHAYCYRHLKENFSSFLSKHNTQGNKGKENALQFLDNLAPKIEDKVQQNIVKGEVYLVTNLHIQSALSEGQGRSALSPNFKINGPFIALLRPPLNVKLLLLLTKTISIYIAYIKFMYWKI
ncbi:hypothetical protein PVL29_018215 [Vitis rotundifolia]|uniref:MULE transposase domain-containing protein n=1 Tax=Vitis rotundifolia TaxID=103349 RepID=A0AA39DFX1_VITRO|nr:hypothetical protein PVL29_018215 [Vitis rotundifolia]